MTDAINLIYPPLKYLSKQLKDIEQGKTDEIIKQLTILMSQSQLVWQILLYITRFLLKHVEAVEKADEQKVIVEIDTCNSIEDLTVYLIKELRTDPNLIATLRNFDVAITTWLQDPTNTTNEQSLIEMANLVNAIVNNMTIRKIIARQAFIIVTKLKKWSKNPVMAALLDQLKQIDLVSLLSSTQEPFSLLHKLGHFVLIPVLHTTLKQIVLDEIKVDMEDKRDTLFVRGLHVEVPDPPTLFKTQTVIDSHFTNTNQELKQSLLRIASKVEVDHIVVYFKHATFEFNKVSFPPFQTAGHLDISVDYLDVGVTLALTSSEYTPEGTKKPMIVGPGKWQKFQLHGLKVTFMDDVRFSTILNPIVKSYNEEVTKAVTERVEQKLAEVMLGVSTHLNSLINLSDKLHLSPRPPSKLAELSKKLEQAEIFVSIIKDIHTRI